LQVANHVVNNAETNAIGVSECCLLMWYWLLVMLGVCAIKWQRCRCSVLLKHSICKP